MTTILPTRRTLAVLMAATLLAVAFAGRDARADQFIPRQDPPTISISGIEEVDTGSSDFTASPVTLATTGGFTAFQPGVEDTTSASTEVDDRTLYAVPVVVETNGELDSITFVALCLFQPSGSAPADSDADVSTDCGYGEDAQTAGSPEGDNVGGGVGVAPTVDPTTLLSAKVTGGDTDADGGLDSDDVNSGAYVFAMDGSNTHGLESVTDATFIADNTDLPHNKTRTFTFVFDLSHAANKGDDWYLRAVAITQPPQLAGDEAAPTPQWVQAVDATAKEVLYYGGMQTARSQQNYGPLTVEVNKDATGITTGDYLANAASDITLVADAFTYEDQGTQASPDDSIGLSGDGSTDNQPGSATLSLKCVETGTAFDDPSVLQVTTSIGTLLADVDKSSAAGTKEDATTASDHDCRIKYGGGAKFGSQTYSNTVTVGIYDATDTNFDGVTDDSDN